MKASSTGHNGALLRHSNHDEPGNLNPNRNSNSPSVDLFFGVPDLLLGYYVTGNGVFARSPWRFGAMLNESQFTDLTSPFLYRERANLIFAFIEGYRQTGDARWLNALRTVVAKQPSWPTKRGWPIRAPIDPPRNGNG